MYVGIISNPHVQVREALFFPHLFRAQYCDSEQDKTVLVSIAVVFSALAQPRVHTRPDTHTHVHIYPIDRKKPFASFSFEKPTLMFYNNNQYSRSDERHTWRENNVKNYYGIYSCLVPRRLQEFHQWDYFLSCSFENSANFDISFDKLHFIDSTFVCIWRNFSEIHILLKIGETLTFFAQFQIKIYYVFAKIFQRFIFY